MRWECVHSVCCGQRRGALQGRSRPGVDVPRFTETGSVFLVVPGSWFGFASRYEQYCGQCLWTHVPTFWSLSVARYQG